MLLLVRHSPARRLLSAIVRHQARRASRIGLLLRAPDQPSSVAVPPTLSSLPQLAILNASSVLGRFLPSFLADQLGVYNMLIPSLVASSVVLFGMLFVKNFTGVIVFGSLYGFTSGACMRICGA